MKNFIKSIDNFIVNKINLKTCKYFVLVLLFMNCYNFFVIKYNISVIDNLLMVFGLDFSILCWFKFLRSIKE